MILYFPIRTQLIILSVEFGLRVISLEQERGKIVNIDDLINDCGKTFRAVRTRSPDLFSGPWIDKSNVVRINMCT